SDRSPPARRRRPAPPHGRSTAGCGWSRPPSSRLPRVEGTGPVRLDLAAAVLAGFRRAAEIGQVGIDAALQRGIALARGRLHLGVAPVGAQAVELAVRVDRKSTR